MNTFFLSIEIIYINEIVTSMNLILWKQPQRLLESAMKTLMAFYPSTIA